MVDVQRFLNEHDVVVDWRSEVFGFRFDARTSRGRMPEKRTYFIRIAHADNPDCFAIGECPLFQGLSAEDNDGYESRLSDVCRDVRAGYADSDSSVRFGIESAVRLLAAGRQTVFCTENDWMRGRCGIHINGLVWMGDRKTMLERIKNKLNNGFKCLKLKIGGIKFEEELELLTFIRKCFGPSDLELRVDANGAFCKDNAIGCLMALSRFDIHSIEQPIKPGQWESMRRLCDAGIIPVALDEELIGIHSDAEKMTMLDAIRPQYIILKPSLCGGFVQADAWIDAAENSGIGWWATSALETNIGLAAIGSWISDKNVTMCQGLGTGEVFSRNYSTGIVLRGSRLYFDPHAQLSMPQFD